MIHQFITNEAVQKADAIVVKKRFLGLLNHYLIYLGKEHEYENRGRRMYKAGRSGHLFMANMFGGIKILTEDQLRQYAQYFVPKNVNRFNGSWAERQEAIKRALSRQNEQNYHLILNNCQHFSTYVQTGKASSVQSQLFGLGLTTAGLVMATNNLNKNKSEDEYAGVKAGAGIVMTGLGLLALLFEGE